MKQMSDMQEILKITRETQVSPDESIYSAQEN